MSLFKWGLAILTWSIDEFGTTICKKRIKTSLERRAPSNPYFFKRTFTIHHSIPHPVLRSSVEPIKLQHRKPITVQELKLQQDKWIKGKYYIEEHRATNLHHDFSIVVNGKVYRMARTPSINNKKQGFLNLFPGPKEKSSWIPQPEHTIKEVPNPSIIKEGYGKGTTKVLKHGGCLINLSHGNNMHVMFEGIEGTYVFIETPNNQTLMMRKMHQPINIGKHKMLDRRDISNYINDPNYIFSTKKDGAGIEWMITESNGHKYLQIFSWRPDAKLRKKFNIHTQIEHTARLKLCDQEVNSKTPLATGRGELWCKGENGLSHINAILNSLPYQSRQLQHKPYLYIHDITTIEGKDISKLPYNEKLLLMESIHKADPRFKIPKHALLPSAKQSLWNHCKAEPGIDGVVAWKINQPSPKAIKLKFKHDQDNWYPATIVDIIPQTGKHHKTYGYPVIENEFGKQFTCSGVGLNETTKADMITNPDNWISTGVRYSAERHFPSGTPFQPIIKELKTE